jgi:hypothetical protein
MMTVISYDKPTSSFYPEDGGRKFFRNTGNRLKYILYHNIEYHNVRQSENVLLLG